MHKCRYWILLSFFISACPSSENADVQQERDVSFIEADVRSDLRGADVSTPDVSINSSDVNVVGVDVASPPECDYETRGGIVVIEAEDLTLSEEWARETSVAGASGGAYISWNGQSFNNDPTHGLISVDINSTAFKVRRTQKIGSTHGRFVKTQTLLQVSSRKRILLKRVVLRVRLARVGLRGIHRGRSTGVLSQKPATATHTISSPTWGRRACTLLSSLHGQTLT